MIVHSRCIVRVHSRCIAGTQSLPLHSVAMGARIAAMAHHPNDGNHAGTNLPTPFNVLPFCLSVSRTSLSLSLPFPLSFSPCWSRDFLLTLRLDTGSLRRHDTSAFADPTSLSGCAFSTRPQLSHSTLRRFIQRSPSYVHVHTFVHLSDRYSRLFRG